MSNQIKTAIITGASSGLGLGVAEAFVGRGVNVVLNARNERKLAAVAERLGASKASIVPGDIGDAETGQRMVEEAVARFGSVDFLLNNAGVFEVKSFTDYTVEDIDLQLRYLRGMYLASQAAARQMRRQGGGAIVNITSVMATRGVAAIPSSAPMAGKGGINALTANLAVELAPDNIRVNTIAPGIVKTPIYGRTDEQFEELNGMQPLGRVGEIKDIVDAVLYLADANWVTGVILPVDGGVSAGG